MAARPSSSILRRARTRQGFRKPWSRRSWTSRRPPAREVQSELSDDAGGFQEGTRLRRELRGERPILIMREKVGHKILGIIEFLVLGIGEDFSGRIIPNLDDC